MPATRLKVPYVALASQYAAIKAEVMAAVEEVIDSGQFILGPQVDELEAKFAAMCGAKYALGVADGTDALILPMRGLGIGAGDEVIVPPNSYLASASAVALAGATPVFVDVRDDYNLDPDKIAAAITPRTKAIVAVHLTGRPADMKAIQQVADAYKLLVFEDAAQAVGATYEGRGVGSFGIAAGFSLHPLKNLAAAGDGGMITTNDEQLYQYLRKARTHGHRNRDECEFWSFNSRLDTLQAAILLVKMRYIDAWTQRRRQIASMYQDALKDFVWVPTDKAHEKAVYHTFIIQTERRDALKQWLAERDIDTKVHYPIPIHLQDSAAYLGYKKGDFPVTERHTETMMSLPVFPELADEQIAYVCESIRAFFQQ
ncbi:MAG: DegT/DnrJ/EryC1/StrS family aminotransferase [Bacteroidetes bacterium]|nr:MAG: DegT/DnrJ/EryC1/StrS family aminotransferase [Bacteroidota bacterium]